MKNTAMPNMIVKIFPYKHYISNYDYRVYKLVLHNYYYNN